MAETNFDDWIARHYRALWPEVFEPPLLDAAVAVLAELAQSGRALEFGIGTGRVAVPLNATGVPVHGVELSEAMIEELRRQPDASASEVTLGDFASATVESSFRVVYLLGNTITNLTTQAEQIACFCNAARHLALGGYFVIENYVPELRRLHSWRNEADLRRDTDPRGC